MEQLKTIAIRVPPELHQQLVLLANLSERPLAEEVRLAVDEHIARRSSEVDLTAQAEKALAEIDKDAASRRAAIESLLEGPKATADPDAKRGRKGGRSG